MSARIPRVNLAGADSSMVRYVIHAGVPYSCQGALTCKKNHASPRDPNLYTANPKALIQILESNSHIPDDNATHVESGKSQLYKRKFMIGRLQLRCCFVILSTRKTPSQHYLNTTIHCLTRLGDVFFNKITYLV